MIWRILEDRRAVAESAAGFGISERTARRWLSRSRLMAGMPGSGGGPAGRFPPFAAASRWVCRKVSAIIAIRAWR
ncbi:hypothetical protein FK498_17875 [Elioraea sp. Yellowstone]|nr:hypothetical protein FK498_17875 [Elioraea sp. Yellowstone]